MKLLKSIYDGFKKLITPARPETRLIRSEQLTDRYSQYPSQGLTPSKLTSILMLADQGDLSLAMELFEEMEEKDADYASQIMLRKQSIIALDWQIIPFDESSQSKKIADFVENYLMSIDFDRVQLEALDAIAKGISCQEIIWDGQAGLPVGFNWIHQKFITYTNSIQPRILTIEEPTTGIELAPYKFLYMVNKTRSGYDFRSGLARQCAWIYLFKNYCLKYWNIFLEKFSVPFILGKYMQGTSQADIDALLTAVRSMGMDGAGVVSDTTNIEFKQASGAAGSENTFRVFVDFCSSQYAKAILGQEDVGYTSGLTSADTARKASVRHDLLESDACAIDNFFNEQLIKPIVGFNFGWESPFPKLRHNYDEEENLDILSRVYQVLASIGQPISAEHISERFNIPLPKEGETPLQQIQPRQEIQALKENVTRGTLIEEQSIIDNLSDDAVEKTNPIMESMMARIIEIMNSEKNYDKALDSVMQEFPYETLGRITEMMTRALFIGQNVGRAGNG